MKSKTKRPLKPNLSDKIADALTVKPKADIEDDQIFGTKPQTASRTQYSSSDSEDDEVISDFRKRNINLLSEINKKYEGEVVSKKKIDEHDSSDGYEQSESDEDSADVTTQKGVIEDSGSEDSVNEGLPPTSAKFGLKKTSDSEDFTSDGESDDYSIFTNNKTNESGESEENDDDEDEEGEGYDISQMEEPAKEEFEHVKKQNIPEEVKKGISVRNQLLVWEGLLEMRIHMQRCMNTANQMPLPGTHEELKKNEEFAEEVNATKNNISNVLEKFMTLQNLLLKKFPETKTISSSEGESKTQEKENSDEEIPSDTDNEEIPSDTEDEETESKPVVKSNPTATNKAPTKKRKLEDYEKEINKSHKAFKNFRDSTIQKWYDKTRLATANNIKNTPTNTVLQQISYILSDREKLVRRTQLKRSEFEIIGYEKQENGHTETNETTKGRKDDDEYITEIFDDSDFYHQLLRELIECKSADISDPVQLSRQWIALQQMRSKMKRKVDTKATKGRKIKYVVHNKLVNFMAPEKCMKWTEESATELYSSLFGKMFENNVSVRSANVENGFKITN